MRHAVCRPAMAMALLAGCAHAPPSEEDELAMVYGGEPSVSIATGSRQSARHAPAIASVVTAQDIAAMGATDLDQVLETVAGLHVNRSANQYSPLCVVRGIVSAYQPQVLVLQNGVPVTTLYLSNKGNVWSGYPVEHIARIEIIRGPGSALYGSDAYAAVINILTNTAADAPGTRAGVRAGSFSTGDARVQHGGSVGPFELAAYLRVGDSAAFIRSSRPLPRAATTACLAPPSRGRRARSTPATTRSTPALGGPRHHLYGRAE